MAVHFPYLKPSQEVADSSAIDTGGIDHTTKAAATLNTAPQVTASTSVTSLDT